MALGGMCVKSPLIPTTWARPGADGVSLQSRGPAEAPCPQLLSPSFAKPLSAVWAGENIQRAGAGQGRAGRGGGVGQWLSARAPAAGWTGGAGSELLSHVIVISTEEFYADASDSHLLKLLGQIGQRALGPGSPEDRADWNQNQATCTAVTAGENRSPFAKYPWQAGMPWRRAEGRGL